MSAGIHGSLTKLTINKGAFTDALHSAIEVQMRQAMRMWIKAAIVRVPVWTGQAQGTILFANGNHGPLYDYLMPWFASATAIPWDITEAPSHPRRDRDKYTGGRKAHYRQWRQGNQFFFEHKINLNYFTAEGWGQDNHSGNSPSAPWFALTAGTAAFKQWMHDNLLRRIPKLNKGYIVRAVRNF